MKKHHYVLAFAAAGALGAVVVGVLSDSGELDWDSPRAPVPAPESSSLETSSEERLAGGRSTRRARRASALGAAPRRSLDGDERTHATHSVSVPSGGQSNGFIGASTSGGSGSGIQSTGPLPGQTSVGSGSSGVNFVGGSSFSTSNVTGRSVVRLGSSSSSGGSGVSSVSAPVPSQPNPFAARTVSSSSGSSGVNSVGGLPAPDPRKRNPFVARTISGSSSSSGSGVNSVSVPGIGAVTNVFAGRTSSSTTPSSGTSGVSLAGIGGAIPPRNRSFASFVTRAAPQAPEPRTQGYLTDAEREALKSSTYRRAYEQEREEAVRRIFTQANERRLFLDLDAFIKGILPVDSLQALVQTVRRDQGNEAAEQLLVDARRRGILPLEPTDTFDVAVLDRLQWSIVGKLPFAFDPGPPAGPSNNPRVGRLTETERAELLSSSAQSEFERGVQALSRRPGQSVTQRQFSEALYRADAFANGTYPVGSYLHEAERVRLRHGDAAYHDFLSSGRMRGILPLLTGAELRAEARRLYGKFPGVLAAAMDLLDRGGDEMDLQFVFAKTDADKLGFGEQHFANKQFGVLPKLILTSEQAAEREALEKAEQEAEAKRREKEARDEDERELAREVRGLEDQAERDQSQVDFYQRLVDQAAADMARHPEGSAAWLNARLRRNAHGDSLASAQRQANASNLDATTARTAFTSGRLFDGPTPNMQRLGEQAGKLQSEASTLQSQQTLAELEVGAAQAEATSNPLRLLLAQQKLAEINGQLESVSGQLQSTTDSIRQAEALQAQQAAARRLSAENAVGRAQARVDAGGGRQEFAELQAAQAELAAAVEFERQAEDAVEARRTAERQAEESAQARERLNLLQQDVALFDRLRAEATAEFLQEVEKKREEQRQAEIERIRQEQQQQAREYIEAQRQLTEDSYAQIIDAIGRANAVQPTAPPPLPKVEVPNSGSSSYSIRGLGRRLKDAVDNVILSLDIPDGFRDNPVRQVVGNVLVGMGVELAAAGVAIYDLAEGSLTLTRDLVLSQERREEFFRDSVQVATDLKNFAHAMVTSTEHLDLFIGSVEDQVRRMDQAIDDHLNDTNLDRQQQNTGRIVMFIGLMFTPAKNPVRFLPDGSPAPRLPSSTRRTNPDLGATQRTLETQGFLMRMDAAEAEFNATTFSSEAFRPQTVTLELAEAAPPKAMEFVSLPDNQHSVSIAGGPRVRVINVAEQVNGRGQVTVAIPAHRADKGLDVLVTPQVAEGGAHVRLKRTFDDEVNPTIFIDQVQGSSTLPSGSMGELLAAAVRINKLDHVLEGETLVQRQLHAFQGIVANTQTIKTIQNFKLDNPNAEVPTSLLADTVLGKMRATAASELGYEITHHTFDASFRLTSYLRKRSAPDVSAILRDTPIEISPGTPIASILRAYETPEPNPGQLVAAPDELLLYRGGTRGPGKIDGSTRIIEQDPVVVNGQTLDSRYVATSSDPEVAWDYAKARLLNNEAPDGVTYVHLIRPSRDSQVVDNRTEGGVDGGKAAESEFRILGDVEANRIVESYEVRLKPSDPAFPVFEITRLRRDPALGSSPDAALPPSTAGRIAGFDTPDGGYYFARATNGIVKLVRLGDSFLPNNLFGADVPISAVGLVQIRGGRVVDGSIEDLSHVLLPDRFPEPRSADDLVQLQRDFQEELAPRVDLNVEEQLSVVNRNQDPALNRPEAEFCNRAQNCLNTSLAVDRTLAGHPTSALPVDASKIDDLFPEFRTLGALRREIATQQGFDDLVEYAAESVPELKGLILSFGPKARVIIGGEPDYITRREGHAFNAIVENGDVRFIDGQGNTQADVDFTGLRRFRVIRTDVLEATTVPNSVESVSTGSLGFGAQSSIGKQRSLLRTVWENRSSFKDASFADIVISGIKGYMIATATSNAIDGDQGEYDNRLRTVADSIDGVARVPGEYTHRYEVAGFERANPTHYIVVNADVDTLPDLTDRILREIVTGPEALPGIASVEVPQSYVVAPFSSPTVGDASTGMVPGPNSSEVMLIAMSSDLATTREVYTRLEAIQQEQPQLFLQDVPLYAQPVNRSGGIGFVEMPTSGDQLTGLLIGNGRALAIGRALSDIQASGASSEDAFQLFVGRVNETYAELGMDLRRPHRRLYGQPIPDELPTQTGPASVAAIEEFYYFLGGDAGRGAVYVDPANLDHIVQIMPPSMDETAFNALAMKVDALYEGGHCLEVLNWDFDVVDGSPRAILRGKSRAGMPLGAILSGVAFGDSAPGPFDGGLLVNGKEANLRELLRARLHAMAEDGWEFSAAYDLSSWMVTSDVLGEPTIILTDYLDISATEKPVAQLKAEIDLLISNYLTAETDALRVQRASQRQAVEPPTNALEPPPEVLQRFNAIRVERQ